MDVSALLSFRNKTRFTSGFILLVLLFGFWLFIGRELLNHFVYLPRLSSPYLAEHSYFELTDSPIFAVLPRIAFHILLPIALSLACILTTRTFCSNNPVHFTGRKKVIIMVSVAVIIGLLAAIVVPSFMRVRMRVQASTVWEECEQAERAKDLWALKNFKTGLEIPKWTDLTPYLKAGSKLTSNGGNDSLGNPFIIKNIGWCLQVNPATRKALSAAVDNKFWGKYYNGSDSPP